MTEWTDHELADILAKANGLFGAIQGLTSTPREAAEIIQMIHMLLFINHGAADTSVDEMLEHYHRRFKENYEVQVVEDRKMMN